jgi:large subunit ribosomal protein L19
MEDLKILKKYFKKNIPDIKSGDTVRVYSKIKEGNKERVQIFEGLVIATHAGKGLDATFKVRKVSYGIGIERTFPLHSPKIIKVERVKQSKVRRSKLYYIRELSGKAARLKELNRDLKVWEEPEAEKEMEAIQEAVAAEAEARAEEKAEEEASEEAKADKAVESHGDKPSDDEPKDVKEVDPGSKADEKKAESTEDKAKEAKEDK